MGFSVTTVITSSLPPVYNPNLWQHRWSIKLKRTSKGPKSEPPSLAVSCSPKVKELNTT